MARKDRIAEVRHDIDQAQAEVNKAQVEVNRTVHESLEQQRDYIKRLTEMVEELTRILGEVEAEQRKLKRSIADLRAARRTASVLRPVPGPDDKGAA